MKRAQRSREFWEKVVFEADSSGLTRAKYAESVGVGQAALSHWLTKLRDKSEKTRPAAKAARLMRVHVVDVRIHLTQVDFPATRMVSGRRDGVVC